MLTVPSAIAGAETIMPKAVAPSAASASFLPIIVFSLQNSVTSQRKATFEAFYA
jgi:hypothetical protein